MKIGWPFFLMQLLLLLSGGTASPAQTPYLIDHYTSDNGLPQNSIKGIAQDDEGFIWLATEDGLARFDGRRFTVFNSQNLDVSNNRVFGIVSKSKVTNRPSHKSKKASFATFLNGEVVRLENGKASRDTSYVNRSVAHLKRIGLEPAMRLEATGFPSLIGLGEPGRYLIFPGNDDDDAYLCDKNAITHYNHWRKEYSIAFSTKTLWHFFTVGKTLYYFDDSGTMTAFLNKGVLSFPLAGDIVAHRSFKEINRRLHLYWDNNSGQAFIYFEKSLYQLNPGSDGRLTTKILIDDFDFEGKNIVRIFYDSTGQKVFLGSTIRGLFVLTKQQFQTITLVGDGLKNVFYAQIPFDHQSIVTPKGIIVGKDKGSQEIITDRLPASDSLNDGEARAMLRGQDGTIWTVIGERLLRLDKEGKKIGKRWSFPQKLTALHQDKAGAVWAGVFGKGLYRIDGSGHSPEIVVPDSVLNITYLESLALGSLLVGTDKGLFTFESRKGKWNQVSGTEGQYIKSIHVFSRRVWWTSLGRGLSFMQGRRIINFPLDKNKYLSSPHCIVDDGKGFFWIPTNKGLFQIAIADLLSYANRSTPSTKHAVGHPGSADGQGLFYMYHDSKEGFNTNEFNGGCLPCSATLSNGYVSLPSMEGLVWFMPGRVTSETPVHNLILDRIEANQAAIPVSGHTIELPMDPENVRLYFAQAYFGHSNNLNIYYALVKQGSAIQEDDWIPLDNDRPEIQFSTMSSGLHTLLVKKVSGFGPDNSIVKKLYLNVRPKWYETFWAKAGFGLLSVMVVTVLVYFYKEFTLKGVIKKNNILEEIVAHRTSKLHETLAGLEASKRDIHEQLHLFSRIVASISHDVQSPLKYISIASQQLPPMIQASRLDEAAEMGMVIFDLSDRMASMLQDLLHFMKIRVYGRKMDLETVDLRRLITDTLELFKKVAAQNNSYFVVEIPLDQQVYCNYQLLSIILRNLIDNAAKYTYNGTVTISAKSHDEHNVELIISNTGRGIPVPIVEMMNSLVTERDLQDLLITGRAKGLGLLIVKEIAELAGVIIKVTQSSETTFYLYFQKDIRSSPPPDEFVP